MTDDELRSLAERLANGVTASGGLDVLPETLTAASSAILSLMDRATLAETRLSRALEALRLMTDHYVMLVNSGDCGNWDPETETEVKIARSVLSELEKSE